MTCAPRSLLKILRVFLVWGPGWSGRPGLGGQARGYASAQVLSLVRVSPRLISRRRLRAAARWRSQALLRVMPR